MSFSLQTSPCIQFNILILKRYEATLGVIGMRIIEAQLQIPMLAYVLQKLAKAQIGAAWHTDWCSTYWNPTVLVSTTGSCKSVTLYDL